MKLHLPKMLLAAVISAVCFAASVTYATDYTVSGEQTLSGLIGGATLTTADTITVSTNNTLIFDSVNNSLGELNITGGTVNVTAGDNSNGFVKDGTISVTQGGRLNINLLDTFGWSTAQGPSAVTLNNATLSLKARQTWGVTNLNLTGNAHIVVAENATAGDDAPALNPLGSNLKINVSGEGNVVDVGIRMRDPLTVVNTGQLTLNGNIYNDGSAGSNHALRFEVSGSSTTTLTGNIASDTQVSVYGKAGTVTFGDGTKAGVASVQNIELGDVNTAETGKLNVAANYTLTVTGNTIIYGSITLNEGAVLNTGTSTLSFTDVSKLTNNGTINWSEGSHLDLGQDSYTEGQSFNVGTMNDFTTDMFVGLGEQQRATYANGVITIVESLVWNGRDDSHVWNNEQSNTVWLKNGKGVCFADLDHVIFEENTEGVSSEVTMNSTVQATSVTVKGNYTFEVNADNTFANILGNGTVTKTGTATLTLGQIPTADLVVSGGTAILSQSLGETADASRITVGEGGRLAVSLANTADGTQLTLAASTGTVEVLQGRLRVDGNHHSAVGSGKIVLNDGAGLTFADSTKDLDSVVSNDIEVKDGATAILQTWGNANTTAANQLTGKITGSGTLKKTDAGQLTISGDMSEFTGSVVMEEHSENSNRLVIATNANLAGLTMGNNTTLTVSGEGHKLTVCGQGGTQAMTIGDGARIKIEEGATLEAGTITSLVATAEGTGNLMLTMNGDAEYTGDSTVSLSGSKFGSVTIAGGVFAVNNNGEVKSSNLGSSDLIMADGTTYLIRNGVDTEATVTSGAIKLEGTMELRVYGGVSNTTLSNNIVENAANANTAITKTDGGTVTLAGSVTVDCLHVKAGALELGSVATTGTLRTSTSTVTIQENSSLHVTGTTLSTEGNSASFMLAEAGGTVNLDVYGSFTSDAGFSVRDGQGKINIKDGGTVRLNKGLAFVHNGYWSNGYINVESGGTLELRNTASNAPDVYLHINFANGATLAAGEESGATTVNFNAAEVTYGTDEAPATINLSAGAGRELVIASAISQLNGIRLQGEGTKTISANVTVGTMDVQEGTLAIGNNASVTAGGITATVNSANPGKAKKVTIGASDGGTGITGATSGDGDTLKALGEMSRMTLAFAAESTAAAISNVTMRDVNLSGGAVTLKGSVVAIASSFAGQTETAPARMMALAAEADTGSAGTQTLTATPVKTGGSISGTLTVDIDGSILSPNAGNTLTWTILQGVSLASGENFTLKLGDVLKEIVGNGKPTVTLSGDWVNNNGEKSVDLTSADLDSLSTGKLLAAPVNSDGSLVAGDLTLTIENVPEPTTGTLSVLALAALAARRRRRE